MASNHRPMRFTADFRFLEPFRHVGTQVRRPAGVFSADSKPATLGGEVPGVRFYVGYLSLAHKAPNCASVPVWVLQ